MAPTSAVQERLVEACHFAHKALDVSGQLSMDADADAWVSIREAVQAATRNKELQELDGVNMEDKVELLKIGVRRHLIKKMLRAQIVESLGVLLSRRSWWTAAHTSKALVASLQAMSDRLEQRLEIEPEEGTADESNSEAEDDIRARDRQMAGIEKIGLSMAFMQGYGWQFPARDDDPLFDKATEAFDKMYRGVKDLVNVRSSTLFTTLENVQEHWSKVVRFLDTMYQRRPPFSSRLRFVVCKLADLSAASGTTLEPLPKWAFESTSSGLAKGGMAEAEAEEAAALAKVAKPQAAVSVAVVAPAHPPRASPATPAKKSPKVAGSTAPPVRATKGPVVDHMISLNEWGNLSAGEGALTPNPPVPAAKPVLSSDKGIRRSHHVANPDPVVNEASEKQSIVSDSCVAAEAAPRRGVVKIH
eukprot:TRINITY_DN23574_c0_g1_i2.p1 TRINITY_DN23574_c0_g1~~TRINITY_DN23574_c0_g1_i2.p1  ORF type:complete len:417 (+),score=88.72 TRINITY_DN23574_c0_g1_i2:41-1291(+)